MNLLVVGSVAYDSVETPHSSMDRILGGSATFFSVAASFFAKVRLVAVVGDDFRDEDVTVLRDAGVDLEGLQHAEGKTFSWGGRYHANMNVRDTLFTELGVFKSFRPELPDSYRSSEMVFLGNIHPELQLEVLDQVKSPRLVAADTMNFWIEGEEPTLRSVLKRIDVLTVNDDEVRQLSGEHNLVRAARIVRAMGPKWLIVKRGEHGALLFTESRVFAVPAYPLEEVRDPTGAGDSFAGGFMGYLARERSISESVVRRAMVMGSVMASFSVEAASLQGLQGRTSEDVEERFQEFVDLTSFD
jgi:sugar/nucleoside kinase (ribokinase family)